MAATYEDAGSLALQALSHERYRKRGRSAELVPDGAGVRIVLRGVDRIDCRVLRQGRRFRALPKIPPICIIMSG